MVNYNAVFIVYVFHIKTYTIFYRDEKDLGRSILFISKDESSHQVTG